MIGLDLLELKSGITYVFLIITQKSKLIQMIDWLIWLIQIDYDLPLEETLILHIAIKLSNSVLNKNQNHYYYNIISLL